MHSDVAVITTVRDDDWFLRKWVAYYGGLFGREALYIINHGDQPSVRQIAHGCNLFPIPDVQRKNFNMRRWRSQNSLLSALRQWYGHVIVCDVDEFLVVDPACGKDLRSWLADASRGSVRTALGFEVVHLPDRERDPPDPSILGPRSHAMLNAWYSKPCLISRPTRLSRGGHYATYGKLDAPEELYLFHMKYCDRDMHNDTQRRRNAMVAEMGVTDVKQTTTNKQWFVDADKSDATFDAFCARAVDGNWDFTRTRRAMRRSFAPRTETLYHFERQGSDKLFRVPDRFAGIV